MTIAHMHMLCAESASDNSDDICVKVVLPKNNTKKGNRNKDKFM